MIATLKVLVCVWALFQAYEIASFGWSFVFGFCRGVRDGVRQAIDHEVIARVRAAMIASQRRELIL